MKKDNEKTKNEPDLLVSATTGRVRNGPSGFLLDIELSLVQQINEGLEKVGHLDGFDLIGIASSNVADRPAGLLADT